MIIIRKIFLPCFALLLSITVAAQQEALFPLESNPVIKTYLSQHSKDLKKSFNKRTTGSYDTLDLPFIDDFSYDGIYPNDSLWSDNNVFINRDFPVDPPTLGVATFDGLNNLGNPYNPIGTVDDYADHLTSSYINLNFPGDTTIWLSFFYQPQGLGEQPEPIDSLILEFKNPDNDTTWNVVWHMAGGPVAPFKQVMINIRDTAVNYLNNGFRFRFTNIGNLNGNVDHWHIDYVRLDKGRNHADTTFVNDGAFLYRNKSLLIPPYTSMPYSHYKSNPSAYTVTSETASYKNLTGSTLNFSNDLRVVDEDGVTDYSTGVNAVNINPYSTAQNSKSISYVFPSLSQLSLKYSIWNINTVNDINPQNDTVKEPQLLSNYYAYDDGTAEYAYGVNGKGAELAYRFDLKMADTLRGVQIYWNQFGPEVHNHLLSIAVWSQITPGTGNDNLIYKYIDQKPSNIDSLNGFYIHYFETPVRVSGTIYVGWIQDDETLLNVGYDKNTDTRDKIFYNALGVWSPSTIGVPGSLMIRPILGSAIDVNVNEMSQTVLSSHISPNPASEFITVSVNSKQASSYSFQLYDALGRLVLEQRETTLNVSTLDNGFYLLKVRDLTNNQSGTSKVFVQH